MSVRFKPFLNQLRRILRPTGNLLCDLIASGQLLVNSEASSVKQAELVLRLIDRQQQDLDAIRNQVLVLLEQQRSEFRQANVLREGKVALAGKVSEAEALTETAA